MGLLTNWSSRARRALEAGAPGSGMGDPPGPDDLEAIMAHQRMHWDEICRSDEYKGRWVALDECRSDEETGRVTEGAVVDVDDDLVELCARIRESDRKNCAILFCDPSGEQSIAH